MAHQIKHTSFDHYFNSRFSETILFEDGTFIVARDGEKYGKLPDGVVSGNIVSIRMAEHVGPSQIECGPVAVFILSNGKVLIYEYWSTNAICDVTETNGFWISTDLTIDKNYRLHSTDLTLTLVSVIDDEKSCEEVKFMKHYFCVGESECYDL